jgi:hypothetical protein
MNIENKKSGKGTAVFLIIIALLISYFLFYSPGNKKVEKNNQTLASLKTEGLPRPVFVAEDQMLENLKKIAQPAKAKPVKDTLINGANSSGAKVNLSFIGKSDKMPLNIKVTGPRADIINVVGSVASQVTMSDVAQINGSSPLVNLENLRVIGTAQNSVLTARLSSAY